MKLIVTIDVEPDNYCDPDEVTQALERRLKSVIGKRLIIRRPIDQPRLTVTIDKANLTVKEAR